MIFCYEQKTYSHNGLNCSPKYSPLTMFVYQIYMTLVLLIVPLAIMGVLYGAVIRALSTGIRMDIKAIGEIGAVKFVTQACF